jgi:enamine deaminase RidA (YjgF/YER057c/UK114 family)
VTLLRAEALADGVPYAYAARAEGLLFTAGACPLDDSGEVIEGGFAEQASRTMDNLEAALEAAGAGIADVAKTTVYVASSERGDLVEVWNVVRDRFGDHDAPSTLLGVAVLGYPGQLVEVEAVATAPDGRDR